MTGNATGDVVPPDKHTVLLQKYIKIGDNNSHGLTGVGHFVPGHFVPGHFVPGHFVPGHFVPSLGHFVPKI